MRLALLVPLVALGLAVAAAAIVGGAAGRGLALKPEGARMNMFRRGRDAADTNQGDDNADAPRDVAERVRAATSRGGSDAPLVTAFVDRDTQESRHAQEAAREADGPTPSRVGEHVATVLESAQQAARTIRQDAQNEAKSMLERVAHEAEETRARANREAAEKRREAERVLNEAKERSKSTRAAAEQFAERQRQDADEHAAATVAEAKATAASIADAANARHEELLSNVSVTEDRLRALSVALRNVASELDDLVAARAADGDSADGKEPEALDESLRARTGAVEERSAAQ